MVTQKHNSWIEKCDIVPIALKSRSHSLINNPIQDDPVEIHQPVNFENYIFNG